MRCRADAVGILGFGALTNYLGKLCDVCEQRCRAAGIHAHATLIIDPSDEITPCLPVRCSYVIDGAAESGSAFRLP